MGSSHLLPFTLQESRSQRPLPATGRRFDSPSRSVKPSSLRRTMQQNQDTLMPVWNAYGNNTAAIQWPIFLPQVRFASEWYHVYRNCLSGPCDRDLDNKLNTGCERCLRVTCFVFWEKGTTDKRAEWGFLKVLYWKWDIRGNQKKWQEIYHVLVTTLYCIF